MSQEREPYSDYAKSVGFFLDAAEDAANAGDARLAIHLYCAAYEVAVKGGPTLPARVLDGLRRAWLLACEQGDRSTAEAVFATLLPYNSPEETQHGVMRLQDLALGQLEAVGLSKIDLEEMAHSMVDELVELNLEGGDEPASGIADSIKDVLERIERGLNHGLREERTHQAAGEGLNGGEGEGEGPGTGKAPGKGKGAGKSAGDNPNESRLAIQRLPHLELRAPGMGAGGQASHPPAHESGLRYANLAGFEETLRKMRAFGFTAAGDSAYRQFVEQTSALHGVEGPALMDAFVFYGPSREDTTFFARATATEIGRPLVDIQIDLDRQGNGSIKLSGPFKRSMFGPPDFTQMSTPYTVLIENIDLLEQMFGHEQDAIRHGYRPQNNNGHSMQAEVLGYLRAMLSHGDAFLIATTVQPSAIHEPLISLIGPLQEIEVAAPTQRERREVLMRFSTDHPSFSNLDFHRLSHLTQDISRRDLVVACRAAVEGAYRESLRLGTHQRVGFGEVLAQIAPLVDHSSEIYRELEDTAVEQLLYELDLEDE